MSNASQEMSKFLVDQGWSFGGNCGCASNESRYHNSNHPDWKIKTLGHGIMIFTQQQNPMNRRDFRPVETANKDNYREKYGKLFTIHQVEEIKPQ